MERIINRLTGLNRFQTLSQSTIRMNLRIAFLENALLGIASSQKTLSTLCRSASKQTIDSESLAKVQLSRSKALICLSVIKALISDETIAMKNRITVIPETFQKSIYYLLLRGRPSKDKNQAPINLCKVVSSLIRVSERLLKIQERLAAPPVETITLVSINAVSGNFLHGNTPKLDATRPWQESTSKQLRTPGPSGQRGEHAEQVYRLKHETLKARWFRALDELTARAMQGALP